MCYVSPKGIKGTVAVTSSFSSLCNSILNPLLKMIRAILASALAAAAMADHPVVHHAPAYHAPAPAYHAAPVHHAAPAHYDETPKPYAFEYGVHDDYSGANFAQSETADGKNVAGSYTVNLPDGRTQTVTYTADHYNGYVADVAYSGQAVYPEYKPTYKAAPHPAPYHAPAPKYHA